MKKMRTYGPFAIGAGFGICVWFLANLMWEHFGHGRFAVMLPVILAQPARLIVPSAPQTFEAVLLPTVLALEYALMGWILSVVVRGIRRTQRPRLVTAVLASLLIAGYALTWILGTRAVRAEIQHQRAADYTRLSARYPKDVLNNPELQVYYAVPLLPFIVACEFDYIYGPLMGWGEGNLWLWRPPSPKPFCIYAYWVH
jgi:hypothetical protein